MSIPRPSRADLRELLRLGVPVTLVQLSLMAMGVEDSMIVGRVSAAALAAVAIGSMYFFTVISFGFGMLLGLEPLISQAVGAGEPHAVGRSFQRGLLIVGVLGLLAALSFLPVRQVLGAIGQPREVIDIATPYLLVQMPSTFAFLFFVLARITLQAHGNTRPILVAILVANVVNVAGTLWLVFGGFGVRAMGPVGSGIATCIARFVMALGLLVSAWRDLRAYFRWEPGVASSRAMLQVLRLGTPAAIQILLEFGVFALIGLAMGNIGAVPLAAHQVALNIASLTYMVPLGIGTAGSVLVGRAIGAGRPDDARRAASAALTVGVGFMGVSAAVFLLAPGLVARAYTNDANVIAVAATLIPLAGIFQVFDGTQCVSIGLLRGTGDTRTPMLVNLVGYWFVGLPLSLWFGRTLHHGPVGLWWGLVAGLAAVATIVALRLRHRMGGALARIHVEEPHELPSPDPREPVRSADFPEAR